MSHEKKVAAAVRSLRSALHLNQSAFAKRLGIGLATIKRWEAGQFQPNTEGLSKLYILARETDGIEAADTVLVFARAANRLGSVLYHPTADFLTRLDVLFAVAATRLTRCVSDPKLTNEQRGALIGEALSSMLEGRQFIAQIEAVQKETDA